jgi:hypothetical protein
MVVVGTYAESPSSARRVVTYFESYRCCRMAGGNGISGVAMKLARMVP